MIYPLLLTSDERHTLEQAARHAPSYRLRQRAEAILAQARGLRLAQVAQHYGRKRETISRWIHAWEDHGLAGLLEPRRPGRPPQLSPTAPKNS